MQHEGCTLAWAGGRACAASSSSQLQPFDCLPLILLPLQTMTVLYQNYPAEMSTLLFWQYLASLATLPAFIFLFLHIIEVWQPGL